MANEYEEKAKKLTDVKTIFMTSILTALAFVVGLFWNDAIRAAIEELVPQGTGIFYKFLAAVIVTVVVVIVTYLLIRSQRIAEKRIKELTDASKKRKREFLNMKENTLKKLDRKKKRIIGKGTSF